MCGVCTITLLQHIAYIGPMQILIYTTLTLLHTDVCQSDKKGREKKRKYLLGGLNITANLYCICLSELKQTLTQLQYRFPEIYETPSRKCKMLIRWT